MFLSTVAASDNPKDSDLFLFQLNAESGYPSAQTPTIRGEGRPRLLSSDASSSSVTKPR